MSIPSRRRWWVRGGLAVYGLLVAIVVLIPVSYSGIVAMIGDSIREGLGITFFGDGWIEFAANILMFVPLGFLLTLLFDHPWRGVILALALSASVELVQIVLPSRQPSLRDVLANAMGAAIGALLAWLIVLRRSRRQRSRATERTAQADVGG